MAAETTVKYQPVSEWSAQKFVLVLLLALLIAGMVIGSARKWAPALPMF